MKNRALLIPGIIIGTLLALGPLWSSMYMILSASQTLSRSGVADPRALSLDIGHGLISTVAAFLLCPIGLALATLCTILLFKSRKAAPQPLPPPQI